MPEIMAAATFEKATFAGRCFWCMGHPFDQLPGVVSVYSRNTPADRKKILHTKKSPLERLVTLSLFRSSMTQLRSAMRDYWKCFGPQLCDCRVSISQCNLLPRWGTAEACAEIKRAAEENQGLQRTDYYGRSCMQQSFYPAEDLPPALLHEKPDLLQISSYNVRPRSVAQGAMGRRGRPLTVRLILQCLPISWHESIRPCKLTVRYAMIS